MRSRTIIYQAALEREQMVQGAIAILINWDEHSLAVLSVLKDAARRHAVPLVVLCGSNKAEHVAALVMGGDICLTHPVSPIMLEARLLAYRRLKRPGIEPPGERGDGLPPAIYAAVSLSLIFDTLVIDTTGLDQTDFEAGALAEGTAYYWRAVLMPPGRATGRHPGVLPRCRCCRTWRRLPTGPPGSRSSLRWRGSSLMQATRPATK